MQKADTVPGRLGKKGRISKWLLGRIDQGRHLLNEGGMCSAVKVKLAREVPEQPRLQQEIHSKASPIKHPSGSEEQGAS